MLKVSLLAAICAAGTLAAAAHKGPLYPGVGRPATQAEVRARDIDVSPDGRGLPAGHGNAIEGRAVYRAKCATCHGKNGKGSNFYPPLAGGQGTLATNNPLPTVGSYWPYATTVWDFINRAMPYLHPGSLTPSQVYSVTAYVLFMNHIVSEGEELNQVTLPKVRMPNRNGFVPDRRPDVHPPNAERIGRDLPFCSFVASANVCLVVSAPSRRPQPPASYHRILNP